LLPIGLVATHPHFGQFSGRSIFGWAYLVTAGSLIGFTAYVWLLDNAPIGTVATYAYVNPVVAIALGAIVLHESLTWTIGVGALLVLACVALVLRSEPTPSGSADDVRVPRAPKRYTSPQPGDPPPAPSARA
jgi:drug/metabolite transporter (DMT)-like permease